jgi:hypothetical protein
MKILSHIKNHIYYILGIIVLIGFLSVSVDRCSKVSKEYKHNLEALNDTIKYYQDANGNLVAKKLAFESDINTLKLLNEDLYNQIDSLKLKKNNVTQIFYVDGQISNPEKDTTYIVQHDTISRGFSKDFNFNNKYRILEGNVNYKQDSLGINIKKDIINFDYTLALDKDNNIYVKSTNPYVKYNEITGFTLPKEKRKRWNIGPSISFGYDPVNNRPGVTGGISLSYGIIQW